MALDQVRSRSAAAVRRLWAGRSLKGTLRFTLLAGVAGVLAFTLEAAARARLVAPVERVPTAIYTRPAAWTSGDRTEPIPIGVVADGLRERRIPVGLDELPGHLIDAVLAVEDQRFHRHHGIDLRRIGGAAVANVRAGGVRQGGSTITQQLAKNLYLSSRRTPLRKVREAFMAMVLEDRYDKAQILEAYLNEIYLGQDGAQAIHGVGAASRYYFGKSARKLSLGESALLAGMIRSPNRSTPTRHAEAAKSRRDLVLGLMVEQGRITERDARRARGERVRYRPHPMEALEARHFRDYLVRERSAGRQPARGASVYSTLDAGLQRAAVRAVGQGLDRLRQPEAEAALVAIDPRTGELLAMVGGRDYATSQFNRATDARRQPGSAFKPIVALAALGRQGRDDPAFTLASEVRDEPFRVGRGSLVWEPVNYDGGYRGEVTFREALEQSLNVPFARIGMEVGPERIGRLGRQLGIESPLRTVPSLALGSSEVTPLELIRAFGVLAAGGVLHRSRTVLGTGAVGAKPPAPEAAGGSRVADAAEVYLVTSALEGVVERGTGRGLSVIGRRRGGGLAGKSGTSSNWRDAWFVAYTPDLVAGVWVGYDDGRSLGVPGAAAALPIVARFLRDAYPRGVREEFPVPDGVVTRSVALEASWYDWDCGGEEVFLEGTEPEEECGGGRGFRWPGSGDSWTATLDLDEVQELLDRHGIELDRLVERLAERFARETRRSGSRR